MARFPDIQQNIRDDILGGALAFGTRVTTAELAQRYGVSQMPIREALRELRGEGLVTMEPNRGARVRSIDPDFIGNIFDIRNALEVLLVRRAAQLRTPAQVERMLALEQALEAHVQAQDYAAALQDNRQLHQLISEIAANPDAQQLLDRHWQLLAGLWREHQYSPERYDGVINDHRHLIQAIRDGDSESAAVLMQAHVLKAKQVMLRLVEQRYGKAKPARARRARAPKPAAVTGD
ncbi:MAG: GntR family transcriptional regulator [Rhodoferax sp.]|jgi:DNA-binding GntR family transcriptional regulator|nr:GntR family transcriptional regulator [Rhodoferax sp.]